MRCCGFRRCRPDEQTVLALLERGVWVHPGYFFGMAESGWLVVSLLAPEGEFGTGVTRLVEYLGTNQGGNMKDVSSSINALKVALINDSRINRLIA
jgi:hypothetical protein